MLYNDSFDRVTMNILTSFPFTFKLAVPGLSNPFSSLSSTSPTTSTHPPMPQQSPQKVAHERPSLSMARPTRPLPTNLTFLNRRHAGPTAFSPSPSPTPSASVSFAHGYSYQQAWLAHQQQQQWFANPSEPVYPSAPAPHSRKRGWEPSNTSPSESQTTLALGSGYLDAPPVKYRDVVDKMDVMEVEHLDGVRELDQDGKFIIPSNGAVLGRGQ